MAGRADRHAAGRLVPHDIVGGAGVDVPRAYDRAIAADSARRTNT